MKNNCISVIVIIFFAQLVFTGCKENYTDYYTDAENDSLAIFSNTGNNLLTCMINDKSWRTIDRTFSGGFPAPARQHEIQITRMVTIGAMDTLIINWTGSFKGDLYPNDKLRLSLLIPKDFSYRHFNALAGKRMQINASSGYFSFYPTNPSLWQTNGTGNIYFHSATLDSIGIGLYMGKMSGLIDAEFPSTKITKGRFDHIITRDQIWF